jgi:hypothetical protein
MLEISRRLQQCEGRGQIIRAELIAVLGEPAPQNPFTVIATGPARSAQRDQDLCGKGSDTGQGDGLGYVPRVLRTDHDRAAFANSTSTAKWAGLPSISEPLPIRRTGTQAPFMYSTTRAASDTETARCRYAVTSGKRHATPGTTAGPADW